MLKYHLYLPIVSSTIIIDTIYSLVQEFIGRHSNSCFNSYSVYLQFDECQVMFIICNNFYIAFLYTRRRNSMCSPSTIIIYFCINHIQNLQIVYVINVSYFCTYYYITFLHGVKIKISSFLSHRKIFWNI